MTEQLHSASDRAGVLTKSTLRASAQLGLDNADLAAVLGVSKATVSRLQGSHSCTIDPEKKEGERALLLIRVFRSLDALIGSDTEKVKAWMSSYNKALVGEPRQLIRKADGLVCTLAYLERMRVAS